MRAYGVLFAFAACGAVFAYSVLVRRPWYGNVSDENISNFLPLVLITAKQWYREGAWALCFRQDYAPLSIEHPLASSPAYVSYLPGIFLPMHVVALLIGKEPTLSALMSWNLFYEFVTALSLGVALMLFLEHVGFPLVQAALFSLAPICLYILTPGMMYFHQNLLIYDVAVLPLFSIYVLLEVLHWRATADRARRRLRLLQSVVFLWGVSVEWLFFFVGIVSFVWRLLNGEMGHHPGRLVLRAVRFWMPMGVAGALLAAQVLRAGRLEFIKNHTLARITGKAPGEPTLDLSDFFPQFWTRHSAEWVGHITRSFGGVAVPLIWGCLGVLLLAMVHIGWKRFRRCPAPSATMQTVALSALLLLPCYLQVYTFRQHSYYHPFSCAKFALPLSLVPFVLAPIMLAGLAGISPARLARMGPRLPVSDREGRRVRLPVFLPVALLCVLIYLKAGVPGLTSMFPTPNPEPVAVGAFIDKHTAYADVVLSPTHGMAHNNYAGMGLAGKRVYGVSSIFGIRQALSTVQGDYVAGLFLRASDAPTELPGFQAFIRRATAVADEKGDYVLYKLPRADFENLYAQEKARILKAWSERLRTCSDYFDVYAMKAELRLLGKETAALQAKCDAALRLHAPRDRHVVIDGIHLAGLSVRKVTPSRFRFSYAFEVEKPMGDRRFWITMTPPAEYRSLLTSRSRDKGYIVREFMPTDAFAKAPGLSVVTWDVDAPPIPYVVRTGIAMAGSRPVELEQVDFAELPNLLPPLP